MVPGEVRVQVAALDFKEVSVLVLVWVLTEVSEVALVPVPGLAQDLVEMLVRV